MAPASVVAEHVLKSIAYSQPTSVEALRELGVRIKGVEILSKLISDSVEELGLKRMSKATFAVGEPVLHIPNASWKTQRPWTRYVVNQKSKRTPSWLESYNDFQRGKHVQAIATSKKKPVKESTIIGHVLKALESGYPVNPLSARR